MKTSQHLKKLAIEIVKSDSIMSASESDHTIHVEKILADIKNALLNNRYYTRVEKVSSTGMSRTIKIAWIKNNELYYAPDYVYKLAGCDKNCRMSGCGFDALFEAQYRLFGSLAPKLDYRKSLTRYRTM